MLPSASLPCRLPVVGSKRSSPALSIRRASAVDGGVVRGVAVGAGADIQAQGAETAKHGAEPIDHRAALQAIAERRALGVAGAEVAVQHAEAVLGVAVLQAQGGGG